MVAMSWLIRALLLLIVYVFATTGNPGCYCDSDSEDCDLSTHRCNFTAHDFDFYTCTVELSVQTGDVKHFCATRFPSHCQSTPEVLRKCCHGGSECNKCNLPDEITYDQCNASVLPSGCAPQSCDQLQVITPALPTDGTESDAWWIAVIVALDIGIVVLTPFAMLFCVWIRRRRKAYKERAADKESIPGMSSGPHRSQMDHSTVSLNLRTIAHDITFVEGGTIGSGAFGVVVKAKYRGRVYAVKKYRDRDDKTCERERRIYSSGILHHSNIVSYICTDILYQGYSSGGILLLVMKFYELGCLADYLDNHTISEHQMLNILRSVADAIEFLHNPFYTHFGENHSGVAHRDLKTRNILVADNSGTCVVGDFGLSVMGDDFVKDADIKIQVGTKRYMAPEVLGMTLSPIEFCSFCPTDIYGYGLVMWEVMQRVEIDGVASNYAKPYSEFLPTNYTIDDVKRVVVDQRKRPELGERWKVNEVRWHSQLASLMSECWSPSPGARPSAARLPICLGRLDISTH